MPIPLNTIEVEDGLQEQSSLEERVWAILSTNGTPTSVSSVTVFNGSTNVTATVMPSGSASISGDVIYLPTLKLLTAGNTYTIRVVYVTADIPKAEVILRIGCPI